MGHVLISPLSWGLGHSTRDIPLIEEFLRRGHKVSIAAAGRAKTLLQKRFPKCSMYELPDYPVSFSEGKNFVSAILLHAPRTLWHIHKERANSKKLIDKLDVDLVLSDQRYNVWHPTIPSFIYNHQLRFMGPEWFKSTEYCLEIFNWIYFKKFKKIIVPDFKDKPTLSGKLSHKQWILDKKQIVYAGPIGDMDKFSRKEDIDVFISVSGPEPQRTVFEKIVLKQVKKLEGKIVIALGKPEHNEKYNIGSNIEVHGFLDRNEQKKMIQRAKMIVCRSGYTTMMELVQLGKKALLVPTAGQTEQVYLGNYYAKNKWYHSVDQYELDLAKDLKKAEAFTGFPRVVDSRQNVRLLYEQVFAKYLD